MNRAGIRAGLVALAMSTAVLGLATPSALASQPPAAKDLDSLDRELIAAAELAGKPEVTILVAAEKGRADAAADELRSIGSVVKSVAKDVDYVRATLPPAAARKAVKLGSVRALDVDGLIARDEPKAEGSGSAVAPPGPDTPRVNPYMPTGDTKAAQFGQAYPSWDGKDVTVAIVDGGIDPDHPALARTSHGERKIIDWYNANAPDSGDSTWVTMSQATYTGQFTVDGRTWTAPATGGPYSIGIFNESRGSSDLGSPLSELGGDVNRDGDRTDLVGVLQDVATKQVRIDLDQDGDFTDERAMTDYKVGQDVGHFGTDNPATPIIERVAFVVQTDKSVYGTPDTPLVNLGIAGAAHGSHIAGIVAGHGILGGAMAGAAPGAKLMSVKGCLTIPFCTASGLIDGVLYAARNGADIISISAGATSALNDGNDARALLYNRTIAEFNVQLFAAGGNEGSGVNTGTELSSATDVVSVGSYITSATWLSNYGSVTANRENLHPFSARGPREDGGFKPNIVAPGTAVSTVPQWQRPWVIPGTYDLPTGYGTMNGTSMATPQASGAAALLVSAYKATHNGKRPGVSALRNAIYSSARRIDGLGAYEQGTGLFDVFGAFHQLAAGPQPDTVTSSVSVNTVMSGSLATPGVGVGIHDREGVVLGKKYTRTYTFTRTTGTDRTVPYQLKWIGNDGTFSSPAWVNLPLNKPVKVAVLVDPRSHGVHSAELRLDNPNTVGIDSQLLNTVVVPQELNAGNGFTVGATDRVARNQTKNYVVRVPEGATSLKIDMQAGGGQIRFMRIDPRGVPFDPASFATCYTPDTGAGCPKGSPLTRTVANPMPGVWEFFVEARRTSDMAEAPYTITATVLTAKVSPNPDTIESLSLGVPVARNYTMTNSAAAFTGKLAGTSLSSTFTTRPTVATGARPEYFLDVAPGSTSLRATIGNSSDDRADLDLFLYNCTTGSCVLAGESTGGSADEVVTVADPAPGRWRVEVEAYRVSTGTAEFDYLDSFTSPRLGSVTVDDTDLNRPVGTVWNAVGTVTAAQAPAAGRKLRGDLRVQTTDGSVIGSGLVIINNVG